MTRRRPLFLRVLIGPAGDQWIAQALDYDIATQAPSARDARDSFLRLLQARIQRDLKLGREPLQDIPPAPERFLAIWDRLEAADGLELEHTRRESNVPPAYVVHAITDNPSDLAM